MIYLCTFMAVCFLTFKKCCGLSVLHMGGQINLVNYVERCSEGTMNKLTTCFWRVSAHELPTCNPLELPTVPIRKTTRMPRTAGLRLVGQTHEKHIKEQLGHERTARDRHIEHVEVGSGLHTRMGCLGWGYVWTR